MIARLFLSVLVLCASLPAFSIETMEWKRLPLPVVLKVGEERVIFVDRDVRVGVPPDLAEHLRVQSAAGAVYLRASAPFDSARLQVQELASGSLILLDVTARAATEDSPTLEPVRIVFADDRATSAHRSTAASGEAESASRLTPRPVLLTRYAAQSLYAPLRTVEPVPGLARVALPRRLALDTLLPGRPVLVRPLAAWRLEDEWVTAVLLTNQSAQELVLDPRALQGDFVAATFQHHTLGPAREPSDATVLYLVTRGHGLADSLLPAISRIDATPQRASPGKREGRQP
jgi:integrating conjugative element protein (TIGR03749 family)